MGTLTLAEIPDLGHNAADCRKEAERCRVIAVEAEDLAEEEAWFGLASDWLMLADAFDREDRLLLN
jgi:hypothetical protein